jgi:hypothetical protein
MTKPNSENVSTLRHTGTLREIELLEPKAHSAHAIRARIETEEEATLEAIARRQA